MSSATLDADLRIAGCDVRPLKSDAECGPFLAWLTGEADSPMGTESIVWALGHFDDGVTWGRWNGETASWITGHAVAPNVSPAFRKETLQELRLFGEQREVLIWRTPAGLRGRVITDERDRRDAGPTAPADETRVLRGDRAERTFDNGFTLVSDATGARQVLPIRVSHPESTSIGVRLVVRHYFQEDSETGVVRVAMTRLVALEGDQHGT
jgi:CRISPR-associated protein (TIGR03984 family)